ncbi:MAG: hypothetical protein KAY37_10415 [Phycisphaerae bacterium]|nr:hypothetical protein [Phycisphaerae bacterium]
MKRAIAFITIGAASALVSPALGELDWSDSPTFTLDMFCQDPSDSGLVWEDSAPFTLDMFCQNPSDSGLAFGDSGVFVLQFADLDEDGDVDLHDFATFARCFTGSGGLAPPGCECADLDGDGDIDADDFTRFDDNFTGPG